MNQKSLRPTLSLPVDILENYRVGISVLSDDAQKQRAILDEAILLLKEQFYTFAMLKKIDRRTKLDD